MKTQKELKEIYLKDYNKRKVISSILTDEYKYRAYVEFDYDSLRAGQWVRVGTEDSWCRETFGKMDNPLEPWRDSGWVNVTGCYAFKREEDYMLFRFRWLNE